MNNYGGNYRQPNSMMGNNPRQVGYQPNRSYAPVQNNPQYNYASNQSVSGSSFPQQSSFSSNPNYGYNGEE